MSGAAGENRPAKTPAGVLPPPRKYGIISNTCRRDGIGRRAGLKILWWRHRMGSTPIAGTNNTCGITFT